MGGVRVIVGGTDTVLVLSCPLTKAAWGVVKQANTPPLRCTESIQSFVPSTLVDIGTVVNGQVRYIAVSASGALVVLSST